MWTWPGALIPVTGVSIKFGHKGGDGTGVGPVWYEGTVRFEQDSVWLRRVMKGQHFFGNSALLRERSHGWQIGVFLILIHAVCSRSSD